MVRYLEIRWVAVAAFMAAALILLVPLVGGVWPLGLSLIFLHSPGYMIHQVEEHAYDRFRTFINQRVFGGREALTVADVLWVNVGAVWGLDLAALYLARFVGLGWALFAPYLMLVNAVTHIAAAVRFGGYNPGLVTSVVIFLPLGGATLWIVPGDLVQHIVGLGVSLVIHAAIVVSAMRRAKAAGSAR
jgi:hypothetical protein